MKRLALCFLLVWLYVFPAQAEVTSLDRLPELSLFFADRVSFVSGVHVDGEVPLDVWLVDTLSERGFYLEFLRNNDIRFHSSITNIQLRREWNLEVNASDSDHCTLTVDTGREERIYQFAFVPDAGFGAWHLER